MKHFKYAIFDLDGTLLDSMPAWKNLGRDYLLSNGINVPDNLNEIIASMSMMEAAEYFQKKFNIQISSEKIISDINKLIENKYLYEMKLKPYAKEYLNKLKNENVNICIATATSIYLAKAALERLGVLDCFSFVASCDEVGVGKNKPDIFYFAANKLNADPVEIAVYDDADFALITAKEAGFFTIGVFDQSSKDKRENIEAICDRYIESFREFI
ncbi:MAG: HAD family phosphatase [Sedimentibacter sp.]